jgi:hypothetical protein
MSRGWEEEEGWRECGDHLEQNPISFMEVAKTNVYELFQWKEEANRKDEKIGRMGIGKKKGQRAGRCVFFEEGK